MNDNRSLHDEFAAEARRLPVTSTGIEVILETAGRRRRRRNVATVGSVLAVTAVMVVGIQQLSRVDEADIPSASDRPAPVATTTPPADVTPTTTYDGPWQSGIDLTSAVPAEASAPVMTWTSYDADSPEALALTYGGADQRYALATEPGDNQPGRNALYEQQDGEWVKVADDVLPEGLRQAAVSGDSIYAIGTAPATAGAALGSVGRYDIANQSWDLLPLPVEARPYRTDRIRSSAEMSIAPIDGGALVVINRGAGHVDYRAVETALGAPGAINDIRWVDGHLEVMSSCDQAMLDERMTSLEANGQPSSFDAEYRAAMAELCTVTTLTAADLGLSAADQAELERPPAAFMYRFDGNTLTPVESPIPDGSGISMQRNVLMGFTPDGTKAWLVQPDATFTPIFADLGSLDGTWIREFDGTVTTGANGVVISGAVGESPNLVDLSDLLTDDTMQSPNTWLNGVASNGAATVAVASIEYRRADAIAEPTTIEGSTYDLVVDPNNGVSVIERATGRQLADGYRLATEPGSLRLVAPAGGELVYSDTSTTSIVPGTVPDSTIVYPAVTSPPFESGPEDVLDEFAVGWQTLAPWSQAQTTKIASSINGRSYAVESFADLVGAGPDDRTELHSVDIVDGKFVLRGWVNDGGDTGRTVILIGTPNG